MKLHVDHGSRDELPPLGAAGVAIRAVWNRDAHRATLQLVDDFEPDLLHAHKLYPHLSVAPIVAANQAGIPVVQTIHDYEFVAASPLDDSGGAIDQRETRPRYRMLNSVLFQVKRRRHVPAVREWISVSRAVARIYAAHGIASTPIPNFTVAGSEPPPRFGDRAGILFVGRLVYEKGIVDVLTLARRYPTLTVRIAGQGELEDKVRAAASELPNLEYLGSLGYGDVTTMLRASALCVMPSRWQEPAGLSCLEAMAAGTPIVAYRSGGLSEYVEDAQAGVVVPWDSNALASACVALRDDSAEWSKLSANGVAASRGTHSAGAYLSALCSTYDRAVASPDSVGAESSTRSR